MLYDRAFWEAAVRTSVPPLKANTNPIPCLHPDYTISNTMMLKEKGRMSSLPHAACITTVLPEFEPESFVPEPILYGCKICYNE